jgi:hypothetical protein
MATVFLSYARSDDEPFAKRLYEHLTHTGFSVWWDRVSMPSRALTFLKEIRDAIHDAERMVVVLGPQGLASDYVRAEWQHALAEAKVVVPILRLGRHEDLPAELKDFHCPDCREGRPEADSLREIAGILRDPIPPLATISGDVSDLPPHFQPRPADLTAIAGEVFRDLKLPVTIAGSERVILMHGMGGVGKSVLAAAFARSTTTRRVFADGIVWLAAGPDTEPLDLARRFGQLLAGAPQNYPSVLEATTDIRKRLEGRRLLLVLDNLWHVEQLEPLLGSLDVSTRVLTTARDAGLAAAIGARTVEIRELSEHAAVQQLGDWLHRSADELPAAAAELARECGYLPFALALNGAMVAAGVPWEDLLAALRAAELDFAEKRFANYPYPSVLKSIKVSFDALGSDDPDAVARYCELGAFDWQAGVPESAVTMLWGHRGAFSERDSRKLLASLVDKALMRMTGESPRRLVLMHDLLVDYLRATAADAHALNDALLDAYRKRCLDDWPSGPNDGYFHQHLVEHIARAGRADEVHRLLAVEAGGANAWYAANDAIGNIDGYLGDIGRACRLERKGDAHNQDEMARQLRYELHYALVAASIRSLAGTLPEEVRTALVRTGVWRGARGLAEANQITEPPRRVRALVDLMPLLDEQLRRRAINDALGVARAYGEQQRPRLLGLVIPHLDAAEREAVLDEALATARTIYSPGYRAEALAGLIPLVSPDHRDAVVGEAVRATTEEIHTAGVNQGGFDAVQKLAPYLSGEAMRNFIATIRLIPDAFMRARAFALTVQHIDPELREAVAREGLEIESRVEGNSVAIKVALARHLPGASDTALFDDIARQDTRQIDFLLGLLPAEMPPAEAEAWLERLARVQFERGIERIEAYAQLLPRLPADRRNTLVAQLAADVPSLQFDSWREQAYAMLAPYLSAEQLRAAKIVLGAIGDASKVASFLVELMDYLNEEERRLMCDFTLEKVDASQNLDVLVRLARRVERADRERVLSAAYEAFGRGASMSGGAMSGTVVEETLARFAEMAPSEAWRVEIVNRALDWIFRMPRGAEWTASGFVEIVRQLPADMIDRGARYILEMAGREAVEAITRTVDGDKHGSRNVVANVIRTLAPFLSEEVRAEAVELAKSMTDPGWRMGPLLYLAPHLPASQRAEIVEQALVTQRTLDLNTADPGESYRQPLLALADCLSGAERDEVMSRALAAARAVSSEWRANGLIEVARRLGPEARTAVLTEAMGTAHSFDAYELAAALPPELAQEVLVSGILRDARHYDWSRGESARAFVAAEAPEAQYDLWTKVHTVIANLTRAELAGRYAGIAPLLSSLGRASVVPDAMRSMMQVLRWWP